MLSFTVSAKPHQKAVVTAIAEVHYFGAALGVGGAVIWENIVFAATASTAAGERRLTLMERHL